MSSSLQLAHVSLRVHDLARSRDFYTRRLGFFVSSSTADRLELAVAPDAPPIFTLLAGPAASAATADSAGLFHAAVLLPSRAALARWLAFAAAQKVDFEGFSDHGVSEAAYLSDPDGNGLEFYADRPRAEWPFENGELAMTTRPLALRELLAKATPTTTPLARPLGDTFTCVSPISSAAKNSTAQLSDCRSLSAAIRAPVSSPPMVTITTSASTHGANPSAPSAPAPSALPAARSQAATFPTPSPSWIPTAWNSSLRHPRPKRAPTCLWRVDAASFALGLRIASGTLAVLQPHEQRHPLARPSRP